MTLHIAHAASHTFLDRYNKQAYKAKEVHGTVEVRAIGQGAQRVYLFVPSQPMPTKTVPVVFFHHGWQGMNPVNFGAQIDHLVRTGHVVIYPVYQEDEHTSPYLVTEYAAQANLEALDVLSQEFALSPLAGQTLYYGFSIGAAISVNLALAAQDYGLPIANALMLVAPGDAVHVDQKCCTSSIYGAVERLPEYLPIVIMTGMDDDIGRPTSIQLANRLRMSGHKRFVFYMLPSSQHANFKVVAGHGSPGAPDRRYNFSPTGQFFSRTLQGVNTYEKSASLNQLDFYGYWKIMSGLLEGLKIGEFSDIVFGQGSLEQLSLGVWADGAPLNPMILK